MDHGEDWLVSRAIPGRSAAEAWPSAQRAALIDALADITRALHALPVSACPFDSSLAVTVPLARMATVDLDDLDEERQGWDRSRLLAELEATIPPSEGSVVCHGDLCLPNVLFDPRTLAATGLLDLGRLGRADPYADLALATRSLSSATNQQFGAAYADRFLSRYGIAEPDRARIAFYRLLDEFF